MNLLNTEYITLQQLIEGIQIDFKKYFEAGLIDEAGLYKVVSYCNQKCGVRINPILCEVLPIQNSRCPLPENFRKVKSVYLITKAYRYGEHNGFYKNWVEWQSSNPQPQTCSTTCTDQPQQYYWTIPYKDCLDQKMVFTDYLPLYYNPHNPSPSQFLIDMDEQVLQFGINEGYAIVTYFADLDAIGLIPKNRLIADWYEWSVKEKVLQDILINSDDDVANKLQYAERQKSLAFIDADALLKSESYRQARNRTIRAEQAFEDQYVNPIRY